MRSYKSKHLPQQRDPAFVSRYRRLALALTKPVGPTLQDDGQRVAAGIAHVPINPDRAVEGPVVKHRHLTVSRQPHVQLHGVYEIALAASAEACKCVFWGGLSTATVGYGTHT